MRCWSVTACRSLVTKLQFSGTIDIIRSSFDFVAATHAAVLSVQHCRVQWPALGETSDLFADQILGWVNILRWHPCLWLQPWSLIFVKSWTISYTIKKRHRLNLIRSGSQQFRSHHFPLERTFATISIAARFLAGIQFFFIFKWLQGRGARVSWSDCGQFDIAIPNTDASWSERRFVHLLLLDAWHILIIIWFCILIRGPGSLTCMHFLNWLIMSCGDGLFLSCPNLFFLYF